MDQQLLIRASTVAGAGCVGIGVAHAATGLRGLPGQPVGDASLDSQERFFGPIFAAYGIGLIRAVRRSPPDLAAIELSAGAMFAGGLARLASWADRGRPHPFYFVLTAVELVAPPVFIAMTRAARRDVASRHSCAARD